MEKTIELTEEVREVSFLMWALGKSIKLTCLTAIVLTAFGFAAWYAVQYGTLAKDWAYGKVTTYRATVVDALVQLEPVRTLVEPANVSTQELVELVAKEEGVSPILLTAIILQESRGGDRNALYAFEPGVFEQRAAIDRRFTEAERRMRASSHGLAHIMGYVADSVCGMHWSELYDRVRNLRCAVKVLREKAPRSETLRQLLRNYNGSGPRADAYAAEVLAIITEMSSKDLGRGLL